MATNIETLKKPNGDQVLPRTRAKAVTMENGTTVESAIGDINLNLEEMSNFIGGASVADQVNNALAWQMQDGFAQGVGSFAIPADKSELFVKINMQDTILTLYMPFILYSQYPNGQDYRVGYYRTSDDNSGVMFNITDKTIELQSAFLNGTDVTNITQWRVFYR